ncbi:unnamed protein product [Parnassius apollo]|uniref:(apollo) hypothetical protein n=1 Tax=Parnassius apollo TaxID=110799 RepID=A0A8S3XZV2_PARAO|nr:unnamed protein product [Parnassius apollo]
MPEKYFFSLLLLFKPWRILDDLKMQHETYTETFNAVKDDLQEAFRYGNLRTELRNILQTNFEKVEEKVAELNEERENIVDEGPDNPLEFEALEAVNAMEDLNNFDLVEADISEMYEQAMIDEVPMISNVTLAYINLRICEVFDTSDVEDGWFGKKHILVLGDLLQLPPVREKSPFEKLTPSEIKFSKLLKYSKLMG